MEAKASSTQKKKEKDKKSGTFALLGANSKEQPERKKQERKKERDYKSQTNRGGSLRVHNCAWMGAGPSIKKSRRITQGKKARGKLSPRSERVKTKTSLQIGSRRVGGKNKCLPQRGGKSPSTNVSKSRDEKKKGQGGKPKITKGGGQIGKTVLMVITNQGETVTPHMHSQTRNAEAQSKKKKEN